MYHEIKRSSIRKDLVLCLVISNLCVAHAGFMMIICIMRIIRGNKFTVAPMI